ncbi:hypothetical protein ABZW50_25035 [Streptomyces bacillaris]
MSSRSTSPRVPRWRASPVTAPGARTSSAGRAARNVRSSTPTPRGGAALVAVGLPELLRLLLVAPWWRDCREFTAEEVREPAAEYLADIPDLVARRDRAAKSLGLTLPSAADALERLREVAVGMSGDFVLVLTSEGHSYEPLFGGRATG